MTVSRRPSNVVGWDEHLHSLEEACLWAGIDKGRAVQYLGLLREFRDERQRTPQHLMAAYESTEIVQVFRLWASHAQAHSEVRGRIARWFKKGTNVAGDSRYANSPSQERNELFVYRLGGQLIAGGADVLSVDGFPLHGSVDPTPADIEVLLNNVACNIECKRPRHRDTLVKVAEKAADQLADSKRLCRPGLVALDCSLVITPPDQVMDSLAPESAWIFVADHLESLIPDVAESVFAAPKVCGVMLYASVPVMIRTPSPLIAPDGKPFTRVTPFHVSGWVVAPNPQSEHPGLLEQVGRVLRVQSEQTH